MKYIIETKDLSKKYGKSYALNQVSIHIPKGSIYGLIGRNGAGKTTLLKIIVSLAKQTSGGYQLFERPWALKSLKRIGTLIEQPALNKQMSALENLEYYRILYGIPDKKKCLEILDIIGLGTTKSKKVENFSLGMKQRLGIGIALLGSPDILILDEPMNGLDPNGVAEIRELLVKLNRDKNITIIISSHILSELSKIATHYGIIDNGMLKKELTKEELQKEGKKYILLETSDGERAINILETKLNIKDYNIYSKNGMKIFDNVEINDICNVLITDKVKIKKVEECFDDIESYYLKLIGDSNNA